MNSSLQLRIENALSGDLFAENYAEREAMNASSYGGSDTKSWLVALGQSLGQSLVLWQPLTLYFVTWIRLWMFTWNIEMKFPMNLPKLIIRCLCGGPTVETQMAPQIVPQTSTVSTVQGGNLGDDEGDGIPQLETKLTLRTLTASKVVASPNRPKDLMAFFSDDRFVIDDTAMNPMQNPDGEDISMYEDLEAVLQSVETERNSRAGDEEFQFETEMQMATLHDDVDAVLEDVAEYTYEESIFD